MTPQLTAVSTDDILALGTDGLTEFMLYLPSRAGVLETQLAAARRTTTRWHANDH